MSRPILTVTVNPALDRITTVDHLVFEDRGYIESTTEAAGGRGINAARVLTSFGASAFAITISGREIGKRFEEHLAQDTFGKEVVKVRNAIRINLTISDRQGLSIKLNERGPALSPAELEKILKAIEKHLPGAAWLMLCGSLPPSVDPHFYTKMIKLASQHKVETFLDTDDDPLLHGIEAHPTIVKPNQSEAERLMNAPLITRSQMIDAVQRIKAMGAKSVVLSLGSRGAIAATSTEGVLEVTPPVVDARSPIGAGDAMAAAIVWSLERGDSLGEALRWGVAAGTASALLPGLELANLEQSKEIFNKTTITRVVV